MSSGVSAGMNELTPKGFSRPAIAHNVLAIDDSVR